MGLVTGRAPSSALRQYVIFAAFGALAAATAVVAPPGAVAQQPAAYVVPIRPGRTASTPAATAAGVAYSVTVTSVYSFDGRFGLADCGHKDPAGPGAWEHNPNITLDGTPARCVAMPFDETHTYRWTETGTGRPFEFAIPGGATYSDDDVGALVAVVTRI